MLSTNIAKVAAAAELLEDVKAVHNIGPKADHVDPLFDFVDVSFWGQLDVARVKPFRRSKIAVEFEVGMDKGREVFATPDQAVAFIAELASR